MSDIVILVGSMRKGGNTDLLAHSFAEGAKEHNSVEMISVSDIDVKPCIGCNRCYTSEGNLCFQNDDMPRNYDRLSRADILVIASPVYFYGISSQLKAVIDRLHAPVRNTFRIRKLGLLLVGATTVPNLFDAIVTQYESTLKFFGLGDIGRILVDGVKDVGDIDGRKELDEAYALGRSIL
ncbi:MAG: flavodoxin family protein [Candidatus Methanomethylophilaceae archaeon]|nr:flavodoxin family protein [Candidatus Methanomethylophilaceae archaeon]